MLTVSRSIRVCFGYSVDGVFATTRLGRSWLLTLSCILGHVFAQSLASV